MTSYYQSVTGLTQINAQALNVQTMDVSGDLTVGGSINDATWNGQPIGDDYIATPYVKADGTRPLSNNWDAGDYRITSKEIATDTLILDHLDIETLKVDTIEPFVNNKIAITATTDMNGSLNISSDESNVGINIDNTKSSTTWNILATSDNKLQIKDSNDSNPSITLDNVSGKVTVVGTIDNPTILNGNVTGTLNAENITATQTITGDDLIAQDQIKGKQVITTIGTASAGELHYMFNTPSNSLRWGLGLHDIETGSNSGSNLNIWRYDDTGSFLSSAVEFDRATNNTNFYDSIAVSDKFTVNASNGNTFSKGNIESTNLTAFGTLFTDTIAPEATSTVTITSDTSINGTSNIASGLSINTNKFVIDSDGKVTAGVWNGTPISTSYISGLGTMASQYADNVNITGGMIQDILYLTSTYNEAKEVIINHPSTTDEQPHIRFQSDDVTKFVFGLKNSENSDFKIWKNSDVGVLSEVLNIDRTTGNIECASNVTASNLTATGTVYTDTIAPEAGSSITIGANTSVTGTLNTSGNFAINTDKFTVNASNGNTFSTGNIESTNLTAFGTLFTDNISPEATSTVTLASDTYIAGDVNVNSKFTVDKTTGNTSSSGYATVQTGVVSNAGTHSGGSIHYAMRTNGLQRFGLGLGVEETGSGNTGSDFYLWRYADDGSFLNHALTIKRSDGTIQIPGNVSVGSDIILNSSLGNIDCEVLTANSHVKTDVIDSNGADTILIAHDSAVLGDFHVTGNALVNGNMEANNLTAFSTLFTDTIAPESTSTITITSDTSIAGDLNMNSNKITNLANPVLAGDATSRGYLENFISSLISTSSNTLPGWQKIGSILMSWGNGTFSGGTTEITVPNGGYGGTNYVVMVSGGYDGDYQLYGPYNQTATTFEIRNSGPNSIVGNWFTIGYSSLS